MSILHSLAKGIVAATAADSMAVAEELARSLGDKAIITLTGDLGAGKTTFMKGIARAWHIQETVTSPTFNIYNLYKGDRTLIHMDAYRLEGGKDIFDELMLEDFMEPPYCLAIEWPSKLGPLPWPITHPLLFEILPDQSRRISLIHATSAD